MSYRRDSGFFYGNLPQLAAQRERRPIGPISFEVLDQRAAVNDIQNAIHARSGRVFAFCNMHTFNMARRLPALAEALSCATVFNDGLGIDIASTILYGGKFPQNLNGTDLTPALLSSFERPVSVFLVGSPPGVAAEAAEALACAHPNVRIVGSSHGFFSDVESDALVSEIRAAGTELLLIGMGNPRQELWARKIAGDCGAVVLCVGAFIDFAAGRVARAPLWVRQLRSEWLYRLALEPSRLWRRYIGGAGPFLYAVIAERAKRKRAVR
ncbi:Polysaccharide biosynthesis protein GumH (fragment) [Burkholderiales bacterium 8X]